MLFLTARSYQLLLKHGKEISFDKKNLLLLSCVCFMFFFHDTLKKLGLKMVFYDYNKKIW